MLPLIVGKWSEGCAYLTNIGLGGLQRGKFRRGPHIGPDTLQRNRGHHRPDIVEHHSRYRRTGLARQQHSDQAAHRGADPMHLFNIEACDQRRHVGHIGGKSVSRLVTQPFAATAAHDVRANDPVAITHRTREIVEITAVARQAVHAHQHLRILRVAPFRVGHAVKTAGAEARETSLTHFTRGGIRILSGNGSGRSVHLLRLQTYTQSKCIPSVAFMRQGGVRRISMSFRYDFEAYSSPMPVTRPSLARRPDHRPP